MYTVKTVSAFVQLAESKTFAEAADKLHITQPALSTSIKKLEEQLGGLLFSRNTRNVSLTQEGRIFLPQAKRLLLDWTDSLADMRSLFAIQQGSMTIAAMPSFAEGRLPALLASFHHLFPKIKIRVLDVVMEEVIESVKSGRAEIGFTFRPERLEGLYFERLFDDAFIAVVSDGHPLLQCDSVSWAQAFEYPFVAMNRNSSVRNWIEAIATEMQQPINLVAEANQLGTVGQLVGQGMGVSIVPQLCEQQMQAKGLVCLPMAEHHLVKPVGMIQNKRDALSVAASRLWKSIVDGN